MYEVGEPIPKEDEQSRTQLSPLAKHYQSVMENSCMMSLSFLQATILITVYEIGHCIYPAAYLTFCHCARISAMFGLHDCKNATQLFKRPDTWTLREEEQQAWWAVLLLDR